MLETDFRQSSATGQVLTGSRWLDVHFEACRPEYEEMLGWVNWQPGWHVLDAGCGSGSYLGLLAQTVGPNGQLTALDLAAANIACVQDRAASEAWPALVTAQVGGLPYLDFPDYSFDAIWCANVTQYLTEAELTASLAEFWRVLRPGGVVAIKDVDMQLMRLYPASQFLITHLCEASLQGDKVAAESRGSLRGRELRRWLERAGFGAVSQRSWLIERWGPLRPVEQQLYHDWLNFLGDLAASRGVPAADVREWQTLLDRDSPAYWLKQSDFYACEGQVVAVGRKPAIS